uniref:Ubiquitin-like domain-containing protein n=1 Tax=Romanomermis culicivorax TaxID=13658 RepID=A0A915IUV3_ROMCU
MQIFVRNVDAIRCVTLNESSRVIDLKSSITDFDPSSHFLSFAGRVLDQDGECLRECGLTDSSTVDLCGRLPGGKVHGSLARAGKVRGQTPKVDKKEKHKKKTGRAKRRLQYTRRFVNVVSTGPGRKRGPNANA